ncbi:DNA repair protein [Pseudovirgaria hyperparasitica]|uniref:DNA repair protein RAD14 n=1 Tax=Pseudovirgaria hyperparasitica TaxID=470096 RepID=A0A6A6VYU4_9PEZI|nr:DNA repair protein [Pseudovirgaria hyperparasitica]KAF2755812.1 DNA repair protein [Pseudovirgaria hyperparasitica]
MSGGRLTPPPVTTPGTLPSSLTPERIRRLEESRLRAKALRTQDDNKRAQPRDNPSLFATGQKRPHSSIISNRPKTQRDASDPRITVDEMSRPRDDNVIQAAKKFDKYVEYDFSKMTDTKGGFLTANDDPRNRAMNVPNQEEKPAHMTLGEWERHQLLKKLRASKQGMFEPGISVLHKDTKRCRECASLEIDWKWDEVFDCQVCGACKDKFPDKYSLLTKTEAREDYILTNPELQDEDLLRHLKRPNPHKATWNDMQLYLRYQIEEYAFSPQKWGSPEALDAEFQRRETDKKRRKEKKFNTKLAELKKRTMVEAHKRKMLGGSGDVGFGGSLKGSNDRHEHVWGAPIEDPITGESKKKCISCSMEVEELEF